MLIIGVAKLKEIEPFRIEIFLNFPSFSTLTAIDARHMPYDILFMPQRNSLERSSPPCAMTSILDDISRSVGPSLRDFGRVWTHSRNAIGTSFSSQWDWKMKSAPERTSIFCGGYVLPPILVQIARCE
jgi:hypothetical protein